MSKTRVQEAIGYVRKGRFTPHWKVLEEAASIAALLSAAALTKDDLPLAREWAFAAGELWRDLEDATK